MALKVILIQPPTEHCVRSYAPQVQASEDGIGFKPPLSLLYIATYLKTKLDEDVKIIVIDCPTEHMTISKCVQRIIEDNPDIVGISAWSDFWYPAFTLGKEVKEKLLSCSIVYGGPHVAIYPQITLNASHTDAVVVGDGERPFYEFVKIALNKKDNCSSGQGLHLKKTGINYESLFYFEKDLDGLPIPDRTFLDITRYNSLLSKGKYSSTMITSRGCPYNCNFCKLHFQKPVCVNAQKVVGEFKALVNLGIQEVEIYDDTFTWSKRRVKEICEGIIKENIKVMWAIRDRVNTCDEELLVLLKKAGCVRINYGIESGVERVLNIMKKGITVHQAAHAVRIAKRLGFEVLTYYMFGNLEETFDDMNTTLTFALSLPADYASFGVTIPYPGTALYENALTAGIISYDYWQEFAKQPVPDFVVPQLIENLCSKESLFEVQKKAMRKFYMRPEYIFRQIKRISSFNELMRKSKMAWGIFLNY